MEWTSARVRAVEDEYELPLYRKRGIALVRGEGPYVWDSDGNRYLDMMSNYGVAILGHAHPAVTTAINRQATMLLSCHQSFYNDARADFLLRLEPLLPPDLQRVSFANSGAESVEAALKYARLATGRNRVVATRHGYHGRTFAPSAEPRQRDPADVQPLLDGRFDVAYGDLEAAKRALPGAAAMILEPVQGEGGVHAAADAYLRGLRAICDAHGVLLIFDEVQTAFRTGRTWAFQHSDVRPDIMTLSKPLANGLPIGVTVVSDAVARAVTPGSHGSTFGGGPFICAVASAVLGVVAEPGFNEHVESVGAYFLDSLQSLASPLVQAVRGVGLMVAVELHVSAAPVLMEMQGRGVLAISAGERVVRFLPPLIVEAEHVDVTVDALGASLAAVTG